MKNLIFPTLMSSGSDSSNNPSTSDDQSVAYSDDVINELSKINSKVIQISGKVNDFTKTNLSYVSGQLSGKLDDIMTYVESHNYDDTALKNLIKEVSGGLRYASGEIINAVDSVTVQSGAGGTSLNDVMTYLESHNYDDTSVKNLIKEVSGAVNDFTGSKFSDLSNSISQAGDLNNANIERNFNKLEELSSSLLSLSAELMHSINSINSSSEQPPFNWNFTTHSPQILMKRIIVGDRSNADSYYRKWFDNCSKSALLCFH